jgi:uncharacterized SAM-binding protein YcdF (DUF218 family)
MTTAAENPQYQRNSQSGGIIFRLLFLMCFAVMLCVIYLARNPLLRLAGSFWIVDEEPQNSDVIVILGDDNLNADRAARAAELFKSGFAPRVIASGRFLRPYASIAELEQHDLTERGVPPAAVVRLTHYATDTREEATAISGQLAARGWKRVILVTSNYHTRRSRYICERLFPAGTILRVVSARDSDYNPDAWWNTRMGLKIFFHEVVGMPVAIWDLRNKALQTAGPGLFDSIRRRVSTLIPMNYGNYAIPVYTARSLYYSASTV